MHAHSAQIVCLLIAQFGSDGGFPTEPPTVQPPTVQPPVVQPPSVQSGAPGAGPYDPRAGQDAPARQSTSAPDYAPQLPGNQEAIDTPTVPVHSKTSLGRAEELIEQFMRWDPDSVEGESITLLACIQRAANTGQQATTIKAYWQLCTALGKTMQAEQELVVLAGITPQFEFDQSQIRAAQSSVEARRAQARVDLLAAQEKLGEVARLPDEMLPLPADRPFVGKYKTRLSAMYAGRAIPRQVRKVDRALPHQLKLIEQRADAVDANARLMRDLASHYRQGQAPLSVLLGTCQELTKQQDKLLEAVLDYNHQIAVYSQAVVGSRLPAESLVSTLIRQRSDVAPRIFRDENVLPASARQAEPRVPPAGRRASNDRPAIGPDSPRGTFEPRPPATTNPAYDPREFDTNSSFRFNDSP